MSSNYYPYGMAQAGRVASTGADYRYGYNGMEEEDRGDQVSAEIASTGEKPKPGEGNLLNSEYRLYDPRLAQWLTRDPVFQPWESPYSAMAGNPILFSDPQGDTPGTETQTQHVTEFSNGGTQTNPQALTEQNGNNITVGSNGALTTTSASGAQPSTDNKKSKKVRDKNILVSDSRSSPPTQPASGSNQSTQSSGILDSFIDGCVEAVEGVSNAIIEAIPLPTVYTSESNNNVEWHNVPEEVLADPNMQLGLMIQEYKQNYGPTLCNTANALSCGLYPLDLLSGGAVSSLNDAMVEGLQPEPDMVAVSLNTAAGAAGIAPLPINRVVKTSGWVIRKVFNKLSSATKDKVAKAISKGIVAPTNSTGIIKLTATEIQATGYTYKIKILGHGGDLRIYGNPDANGHIIFDYIDGH